MTRNLKKLGLVLAVTFVLGAVAAQGALAADAHEFHSDGKKSNLTGINVGAHVFQVGAVGTVSCTTTKLEGTIDNTVEVNPPNTWSADELTLKPSSSGCTFGGQAATVFVNDCAYVFDTDTTAGNPTGGKHAKFTIECDPGHTIEIHTVNCTITIAPQEVPDAVSYKNDTASSIEFTTTAHNIVVGKKRSTAAQPVNGCLAFPTGAIGKATGTTTVECRKDEDINNPSSTERTTPGATQDATTTACSMTDV